MARLTYANVVSTLALFAALGGGAYAAINLPKNSVTTVQVKNGSLLAKDFKKGQLKAGARGLAGPAGLQGAKGAAGVQGIPGVKGDPGLDGSAKAYAYIGGPGTVGPDAHGITSANVTANLSNQFTDQISEYCIH